MAAAIWYVRKAVSEDPAKTLINGVHSAIINADDGGSEATTLAEAEATLGLPSGYFSTAVLGLTALGTDEDAVAFGDNRSPVEVIA